MKIKPFIPVLICGLIMLNACTKEDTSGCKELVISNRSFEDRQESISNLDYEDGILSMTITYNKCSTVHDFDLIWDGSVMGILFIERFILSKMISVVKLSLGNPNV